MYIMFKICIYIYIYIYILLVCDWPYSVWTKSLVCKDAV